MKFPVIAASIFALMGTMPSTAKCVTADLAGKWMLVADNLRVYGHKDIDDDSGYLTACILTFDKSGKGVGKCRITGTPSFEPSAGTDIVKLNINASCEVGIVAIKQPVWVRALMDRSKNSVNGVVWDDSQYAGETFGSFSMTRY